MSETFIKVVMVLLLSTLFPLAGFYLDYRANKRRFKGGKPPKQNPEEPQG